MASAVKLHRCDRVARRDGTQQEPKARRNASAAGLVLRAELMSSHRRA
jgi:hypothetical protein